MKKALICLAIPMIALGQVGMVGKKIDIGELKYGGKIYRNATAEMRDADTVTIWAKYDRADVPWKDLPPNIQFRLKPEREKLVAEKNAKEAQEKARWAERNASTEKAQYFAGKGGATLIGKVFQVLPEGLLIQCDRSQYGPGYNDSAMVEVYYKGEKRTLSRREVPVMLEGLFLLKNHPTHDTAADGDPIAVLAWPQGRFQYQSAVGALKTVKTFTVQPPDGVFSEVLFR